MKELVCITCPNSCRLTIEGNNVTGNKCQRGREFALAELHNPTRSVTTTVATIFVDMPVLSVRTNGEIPKSRIFELMEILRHVRINKRYHIGDIVVSDPLGVGIDVVATKNME